MIGLILLDLRAPTSAMNKFLKSLIIASKQQNLVIFRTIFISAKTSKGKNIFPSNNRELLNFRSGRRVPTLQSGETIEVVEPATGKELCSLAVSGEEDVLETVKAAKLAFNDWSSWSGAERGRVLIKAAETIRYYLEDVAVTEVQDCGKPIWEARFDVSSCADCFEYFGSLAASLNGQHIPLSNNAFAITKREPLGICAGIGAWNYPFLIACWKAAPALACGNSVIYKPSSFTPLTSVMLGEILKESGMPDGCYNVLQGDRKTGHLLNTHPDIAKVSFTGSIATGKEIMKTCAEGVKKLTLELGGKSALIIFEDCDMNNAVNGALMANFLSQGEVCSNATRVFVQKTILQEFLHRLVEKTKAMKIGNPMDPETRVGPSITPQHAQSVLAYIHGAVKEGAKIACGGERVVIADPRFSGGYYLSPCVLVDCHDDMTIVKEEVFGAVMSILTFDNEDEVVRRANNTTLGLSGGVFTKDLRKAHHVANKMEAGIIWINNYNLTPPQIPFGGYKMSGIGRENGTVVLDHYTQVKTIYVEMGDVNCPF